MAEATASLRFPKPERRVRDRKVLTAYLRAHPHCEVGGCRGRLVSVHHIVSRKMGGGDVPENLLSLCAGHHAGPGPFREAWHAIGGRRWFARFGGRLADETRAKVMRALRIEEEGEEACSKSASS